MVPNLFLGNKLMGSKKYEGDLVEILRTHLETVKEVDLAMDAYFLVSGFSARAPNTCQKFDLMTFSHTCVQQTLPGL